MSSSQWDIEAAQDMSLSDDPSVLADNARMLPDLIMKWGERYSAAKLALALADQELDLAEAIAFISARGQARPDGKLQTVEDAKARVQMDPDYQAARQMRNFAEAACIKTKITIDALIKKGDMIREIGANQRADTRV